MKKLINIIFLILILFSCNKENNNLNKNLSNYIGKYQTVSKFTTFGAMPYSNIEKDTIISVDYGNSDTTLIVLNREVWLDKNREFYDYHYGLQFRNDSIFSTFMNGGLGGGNYEYYVGYKISDKP